MRFRRLQLVSIIVWFCSLSVLDTNADATETNSKLLQAKISEASDYLNYKPGISLQMINELEGKLQYADNTLRLDAWLVGIWAGIYLSDGKTTKQFSEKIISFLGKEGSNFDYNSLLIAIGVHLWRHREYSQAYLFAVCGIKNAKSAREKLRNLTLLGMSSHQRDLGFAQRVYRTGLNLAKKHRERRLEAVFTANLGALSLRKSDFINAERYLSDALDMRYRENHIAGQTSTGINLMLTYFMQKKWDYFTRLAQRMSIVLQNHPSDQYQNYYHWLIKAWQMQGQSEYRENDLKELSRLYHSIKRPSIQSIIRKAALTVNITLNEVQETAGEQGEHFLTLFPVCDWEKYQNMPQEKLLAEVTEL